MSKRSKSGTHPLEREFHLEADEILDAINARPRCKMSVKGAVAEQHLHKHLAGLVQTGDIDEFRPLFADHEPDFVVIVGGNKYLLECKNVEQPRWTPEHLLQGRRPAGKVEPIRIDFKKTRNQKTAAGDGSTSPKSKGAAGRFYDPDKFSVLAACLANRTGDWEFRFIGTQYLARHKDHTDRLSDKVEVDAAADTTWKTRLRDVLDDPATPRVDVGVA